MSATTLAAEAPPLAIAPPPPPSQDDGQAEVEVYRKRGIDLSRSAATSGWAIGDWFNDGERFGKRYGERADVIRSPDWVGPSYGTTRNYAAACKAFNLSARRDKLLSIRHHIEAAKAPDAERAALLQWAIDNRASCSALRKEVRQRTSNGPPRQTRKGKRAEQAPPVADDPDRDALLDAILPTIMRLAAEGAEEARFRSELKTLMPAVKGAQ